MNAKVFEGYLQGNENITRSAAFAYLGQHSHLLPDGVDALTVAEYFADLVEEDQRRMDAGKPVSYLPSIWVALARSVGLTVEMETGRIVDGPKAQVPVTKVAHER